MLVWLRVRTVMKVVVCGLGYVGFTASCCIASQSHEVLGIGVSEKMAGAIREGRTSIMEPAVQQMPQDGLAKRLFRADTVIAHHLDDADLAIVFVGTPAAGAGSHNMAHIADVSRQIAQALHVASRATPLPVAYCFIIRPGSVEELIHPIFEAILGAEPNRLVALVYNREFQRKGSAVKDFFEPPKIVIGARDGRRSAAIEALNRSVAASTFNVDYRETEFTKSFDNAGHALKVAYANEIGRICLNFGIRATQAHGIFEADTKLNLSAYCTRPGGAFGGSYLLKDARALQYAAGDSDTSVPLVNTLSRSDEVHKPRLYEYAAEGMPHVAKVLPGRTCLQGRDGGPARKSECGSGAQASARGVRSGHLRSGHRCPTSRWVPISAAHLPACQSLRSR